MHLTDFEKTMIERARSVRHQETLPAARNQNRRRPVKPEPEIAVPEEKTPQVTKAFFSMNTPENEPIGVAFPHGEYLLLLVREDDRSKLSNVMFYPRAGARIEDLPEEMNIRDLAQPGKWAWAGEIKRTTSGRAMRGRITRLPQLPWMPDKGSGAGRPELGGYRLIAMSKLDDVSRECESTEPQETRSSTRSTPPTPSTPRRSLTRTGETL